jgi:curved DNA-binding protein
MSVAFKDYYAALGVARDATADEIKQAFRNLARLYHPDVAKDKATAEAKFKEINEANEVLGDPEKREKYDLLRIDGGRVHEASDGGGGGRGGAGGGEQEFHFGGTGFSDFFERYFSGGTRYGFDEAQGAPFAGARAGEARRGSDIEGDILVSLDEAMRGAERPVSLRSLNRETGGRETQAFTIRIPPGATDGRRIRVPGRGEPGLGGAADGDLFLRVRHAAHPEFTTRGADVFHELDIAPWEAVLGAEATVPTLDGAIRLRIPPLSAHGLNVRARGRGLPRGKAGERGDFFVVLTVQLPREVDAAERLLWENLRDHSVFKPRAARSSS